MLFLWIVLGFLLLILLSSFVIYRFSFHHIPGGETDSVKLPEPAQSFLEKNIANLLSESCERISISSFDGLKLSGRYFSSQRENSPLVIAFHGYKGCADNSFACIFPIYRKLGFQIIIADQRAHGKSEGKTISLGVLEHRDVASWVEYSQKRFGKNVPISLWGVSMGGASVLNAAPLCPELCCIVSDCAFTSPNEICLHLAAEKLHGCAKAALPFTSLAARLWGDFHLNEASALKAVQNTKVPILFIHGELDTFVPYEMGKRLYNACKSEKEFLSVPDAEHARSAAIHPELYEKALSKFVKKYI